MSGRTPLPAALALLLGVAPAPLAAQRIQPIEPAAERESIALEVAKWTSGGLAVAAGVAAFVLQDRASERFADLEAFCSAEPDVCRQLNPDGSYADAATEARYQDIRRDFRDARWTLIGAHALAVGTIVLFVLDLPQDPAPENIPYEPPALRVGIGRAGTLEASITYPVSNIFTRSP